jgi:signal transduction histidine kinase
MKRENENILMTVSDNGEGISEKNLGRIFEMFYRASNSSAGTGLGLYICKEIATKLGGEITISSVLGEGTQTLITLPVKNDLQ